MRKAAGGYTIIEVMLVLAISSLILFAALLLFRGQQGETAFDVSVHDANSEITDRLKEVSTALSNFPDQYSCSVAGSPARANITAPPAADQGTNTPCIVLGKAFWPHQNQIDVYTVVGCRLQDCNPGGSVTQDLARAQPTISPTYLKQTYTLTAANIKSSKVVPTSGPQTDSSLVGYYIDLTGSDITGSATVLQSLSYNFAGSNENQAKTCIESSCAASNISTWSLCLESVYNNSKTAKVEVSNTARGISTNLKFEDCT